MKVVIFGSTGRTGKYLIQFALEQGHEVTAFARNPSLVTIRHARLSVFQGDATNENDVEKALIDQDVVLSAIGTDLGQTNLRQTAIQNIVEVMQNQNIRRVIAIGGMGILQANSSVQIFETDGFPKEYIPVSLDHNAAYKILENSGTDYTLVCPPMIVEGSRTDQYQTEADYPPKGKVQITTGDLAWFMVNEITDNQYIRKRVGITIV